MSQSPLVALVWKLLRDVRVMLIAVAVLLAAFQCLWAKVTQRLIGQLVPMVSQLAGLGGLSVHDVESEVFKGPGQFIRTIIGGERVDIQNAMDMLSIGYVHPLMVTLLCIWGIGRAAGAIAGEIDRGTMELLLAQPLGRSRLVLAHLAVDALTIPLLCLSLWAGNWVGAWLVSPIQMETPKWTPRKPGYVVELPWFKVKVDNPAAGSGPRPPGPADADERLRLRPAAFGPALWLVGGLIFAVSGSTMWLSAAGRFRWRVLGVAVFVFLIQFLINTLAQMWDTLGPLRPLTLFYYYQPQEVILPGGGWDVSLAEWNGGRPLLLLPMPLVLFCVGLFGYGMALWTFHRRDLPAPL
jgi:ABC-2 type transport system permease protein